jgi:transcriptional regulator with XRE-family HTH domain
MDELLSIREELGLSQTEMADKLGLHQSTISRFERGELPVDKRTLLAAQALLAQAQPADGEPKQAAA